MNYVFGPVPSRRLGKSLGVDPLPLKTCNWNCVYCQLGRTQPLTNTRKSYFNPEEILKEVHQTLATITEEKIDWITLVGSGETCLYSQLGWLLRQIKLLTHIPVAVITNGSLLYMPEVRDDLSAADLVMPSLDAGSPELYRRINRPHPQATFSRLLEGLKTFRDRYNGQLWLEVMLVRGLNDTEPALNDIAVCLDRIQPDEVHILVPERPPAETWVQSPDEDVLMRGKAVFGKTARVFHQIRGSPNLISSESIGDLIVGIITRHPMQASELIDSIDCRSPREILDTLAVLEKSGKVKTVERFGIRYWVARSAHFP
jgi:wyosine [tRNA(Phe)-imidazoG37] synthetase (radical SAM superfamily)